MIVLAQVAASTPPPWVYLLGTLGSLLILGGVVLVALAICLRDTPPESRPAIINALADLFRGWFRKGPRGGS